MSLKEDREKDQLAAEISRKQEMLHSLRLSFKNKFRISSVKGIQLVLSYQEV
jgi:hypothetical protein